MPDQKHMEDAIKRGYETQDFGFKIVMYSFITLAVLTALSIGIALVFFIALQRTIVPEAAPNASPLAEERTTPPNPVLQALPTAEMAAYSEQMEQRLNNYGWVDRAQGVVHIPIDQAISLVASGSGMTPAPAAQTAAPAQTAPPAPAEGQAHGQ